jgi:hypothetical protein
MRDVGRGDDRGNFGGEDNAHGGCGARSVATSMISSDIDRKRVSTYSNPVANMHVMNIFLLKGTFNLHRLAVGRSKMTISDAMLKAP